MDLIHIGQKHNKLIKNQQSNEIKQLIHLVFLLINKLKVGSKFLISLVLVSKIVYLI